MDLNGEKERAYPFGFGFNLGHQRNEGKGENEDDLLRSCTMAEEGENTKSNFVSTKGKEGDDAGVDESVTCVDVSLDVSIGEGNASGSSGKQATT
ncbi:hypothetical protein ACH5RR_028853 [Cinchona calisaya]|uniref:Uncharacterized protein n=1 Tax=Cinchona calisaya TaxID=153742 RepID=A0ABD2YT97_9GENT